jgi:hypothetical protein
MSELTWRQYILSLITAAIIAASIGIGVTWYGYSRGIVDFVFADLYRYQRTKLHTSKLIDVLFVGDSSLGNAVGAKHWLNQTDQMAVNVALTGAYGYAGSLNMVRQTLDHTYPRNVVVIQTLDIASRPVPYQGFAYTYTWGIPFKELPLAEIQKAYFNANALMMVLRGVPRQFELWQGQSSNHISALTDYVEQRKPLTDQGLNNPLELNATMIDRKHANFLLELGKLCRSKVMNCVYAHGPIYEAQCNRHKTYIDEVNNFIKSAGFVLANDGPLCIPKQEVGDAIDHVHPELQAKYTDLYQQILMPYLR